MTLLLALLFVAAPDTTLPPETLGSWVNPDTVAIEMVIEEGGEPVLVVDTLGVPVQAFLYQHLHLTDSTFATLSVFRDQGQDVGIAWTSSYSVRDGHLTLSQGAPMSVLAEGDSLVLERPGQPTYGFRRGEALTVPPGLIGTWAGDLIEPGTGVPVGVSIELTADQTMIGTEGPIPFRIAGPYLLLERDTLTDATGTTTVFDVLTFALRGDGLALDMGGPAPITLVRQ